MQPHHFEWNSFSVWQFIYIGWAFQLAFEFVSRVQYFIHPKFLFILPIWIDYHIFVDYVILNDHWQWQGCHFSCSHQIHSVTRTSLNVNELDRFEQISLKELVLPVREKFSRNERWKYPLITHTRDQFHWFEQFPLFSKHSSVQVEGEYFPQQSSHSQKHIHNNTILLNVSFAVENEILPKRINFGKHYECIHHSVWIMARQFFEAIKPIFVVNEDAFEVKYGMKS